MAYGAFLQPKADIFGHMALFALICMGALAVHYAVYTPRINRQARYKPAPCSIIYIRVASATRVRGSGSSHREVKVYYPEVMYRYEVNGKNYTGTNFSSGDDDSIDRTDAVLRANNHPAGTSDECWYDPEMPSNSFLVKNPVSFQTTGILFALATLLLAVSLGLNLLLYRQRLLAHRDGQTQSNTSEHDDRSNQSAPRNPPAAA